MARDIAEGYVTVNPIFLKPFDDEGLKEFYHEVIKVQGEVRGEKFPYNNVLEIRLRNLRLQRLHTSAMVIRNFARARRIPLI